MKLSLFLLGLLFNLGVLADSPPLELTALHGVLLPDVLSRQSFAFQPGKAASCKHGESEGYVIYNCETEGARFVSDGLRGKLDVSFTRFWMEKVDQGGGAVRTTFVYSGKWEDTSGSTPLRSNAELELTSFSTAPGDWQGRFSLTDYGLSAGVQARPAPEPR